MVITMPQVMEEITDMIQHVPQERKQARIMDPNADITVPQNLEDEDASDEGDWPHEVLKLLGCLGSKHILQDYDALRFSVRAAAQRTSRRKVIKKLKAAFSASFEAKPLRKFQSS